MQQFKATAVSFILFLNGCSASSPLIPDEILSLSPSVQIPYEVAAAAIIAWQVIDPLAPTWDIQHSKLSEDRYRISLRQKKFASGGDGEAQYIFRRHALSLTEEHGFSSYTVMSYEESVESGPLIGQRVSYGVIQLGYAPSASAMQ